MLEELGGGEAFPAEQHEAFIDSMRIARSVSEKLQLLSHPTHELDKETMAEFVIKKGYTLFPSNIDRMPDVNAPSASTGLTLIQRAIGLNQFETVKLLLAHGAALTPDPFGRMPSLIAIQCHASDELIELVSAAEEAADV